MGVTRSDYVIGMSADLSYPVKLALMAMALAVGSVIAVNALKKTPAFPVQTSSASAPSAPRHPVPAPAQAASSAGSTTIHANSSGHYIADAFINGRSVSALIDTGATSVTIPFEEAMRLGLRVSPDMFVHPASTANGRVNVARVILPEVKVGSIAVANVEAMVTPAGALRQTLLGMNFLARAGKVEMTASRLVIRN